jgi:hypothetical protein
MCYLRGAPPWQWSIFTHQAIRSINAPERFRTICTQAVPGEPRLVNGQGSSNTTEVNLKAAPTMNVTSANLDLEGAWTTDRCADNCGPFGRPWGRIVPEPVFDPLGACPNYREGQA